MAWYVLTVSVFVFIRRGHGTPRRLSARVSALPCRMRRPRVGCRRLRAGHPNVL
jgi:hypothetical protein